MISDVNEMKVVELFAGGGGVAAGLRGASIPPLVAVEFDPDKPDLSNQIADCYERNFPGSKVIRKTVQQLAEENFPNLPRNPDIIWASPVCSNFSTANNKRGEAAKDIEAAKAIAKAIEELKPDAFFLENVSAYATSQSWAIILEALGSNGYSTEGTVENLAEYGVPQNRKRFIVRSARGLGNYPWLPQKSPVISWYDAIEDLILELPESDSLTQAQKNSVEAWLCSHEPQPLLLKRTGRGSDLAVPSDKPSFPITRMMFTDGNGGNRNLFADIWLPDGKSYQVSLECIRRLQTFPETYQLPDSVAIAGSILGYSVPPMFVKKMIRMWTSCRP